MSNYTKLKTNLKLSIQRLKLLEKKKTELSLKSRKEIADYLAINKADRARIRVEHIIREDNYVEAMEMLEMYCDLLLARFGLIEKMKELDPGLDEAIATVIWASPRISNDIQEFKIIGDIFANKYGKKYAESCKVDALNNVNEKVKKRLGLDAPSKLLVEQYLIEIAKNFNIKYEPDQQVMLRSGHIDEELISLRDKTNEITRRHGGDNNNDVGSGGGAGGGGGAAAAAVAIAPPPENLIGFNLELPPYNSSYHQDPIKQVPNDSINDIGLNTPPLPSKNDYNLNDQTTNPIYNAPPRYDQNQVNYRNFQQQPPPPASNKNNYNDLDDDLGLPSVPSDNNNQLGPNNSNNTFDSPSLDFDELSKRFANLKNK